MIQFFKLHLQGKIYYHKLAEIETLLPNNVLELIKSKADHPLNSKTNLSLYSKFLQKSKDLNKSSLKSRVYFS